MHAASSTLASDEFTSAVELLTAYRGESAVRFEPNFRHSEESRIVAIEMHAVGNDSTTARYTGGETPWTVVNNILQISTADGFQGVSGVDSYYQGPHSDAHLAELRDVAADLVGAASLDPVVVGAALERMRPQLSDAVRSSIDIALWDLAARKAGLPLYELFGSRRDAMEPYASLPFFDTLDEHLDAVDEYVALGFDTFKFHVWGEIEKDLELVRRVQAKYDGSAYRFMIDLEGAYNQGEAIRLGRQMEQGLFILLEAPIDDERLAQYREIREALSVQLIPAGYSVYSADFIREGIAQQSWDAGRFDATVVGGISAALKLLAIANDAGMGIEIQSWGHSLTQAANLHLMLANERTQYFEVPTPITAYEFCAINGNLLDGGKASVPDRPGLGIQVDWDRLARADFHVHIELDYAVSPE